MVIQAHAPLHVHCLLLRCVRLQVLQRADTGCCSVAARAHSCLGYNLESVSAYAVSLVSKWLEYSACCVLVAAASRCIVAGGRAVAVSNVRAPAVYHHGLQ